MSGFWSTTTALLQNRGETHGIIVVESFFLFCALGLSCVVELVRHAILG